MSVQIWKKAVAVIGTGFIAPVHVEALRRIGVPVRGILGSNRVKSEAAAIELGLEKAYAEYSEVLDDPAIGSIHVATPNRLHHKMVMDALDAGKHVLCEKPLAMSSFETANLIQRAGDHPELVTAVNYNTRFYPLVLQARELVQNGVLGQVYSVRGAFVQDWLLNETDWNWRLIPDEGGEARVIGDIGTHWMDLMLFITGLQIESVFADLATFIPARLRPSAATATFKGKETIAVADHAERVAIKTEDWGSVLFRFSSGARGSMCVSQVTAGRKNQITFEISGSKGALAWDSEHPNVLWLGYRQKANELLIRDPSLLSPGVRAFTAYPGGHNEGFPDTLKQLCRSFYDYIAKENFVGLRIFADFQDGHFEVLLCEAILKSSRSQTWASIV